MLDDDARAQVCISNAVPTVLDYYDAPEGFEMVSLYCIQLYTFIPVCSIEAISFYLSFYYGTTALCAESIATNSKTL